MEQRLKLGQPSCGSGFSSKTQDLLAPGSCSSYDFWKHCFPQFPVPKADSVLLMNQPSVILFVRCIRPLAPGVIFLLLSGPKSSLGQPLRSPATCGPHLLHLYKYPATLLLWFTGVSPGQDYQLSPPLGSLHVLSGTLEARLQEGSFWVKPSRSNLSPQWCLQQQRATFKLREVTRGRQQQPCCIESHLNYIINILKGGLLCLALGFLLVHGSCGERCQSK